jgi:hypothetical protein
MKEFLDEKNEVWYSKSNIKNKDIIVFHKECPYALSKNGCVAEHRYIWWLNYPDKHIEYNEKIHHINGNHQDNRIENLEKVNNKLHIKRHKDLNKNKP